MSKNELAGISNGVKNCSEKVFRELLDQVRTGFSHLPEHVVFEKMSHCYLPSLYTDEGVTTLDFFLSDTR